MDLHRIATAAGAVVLLTLCAAALAAPEGITVSITPERQSLGKNDEVMIKVTVSNTSASPQVLLKWQLPLGEIEAPLFEVTRDGNPVRYLGMWVKRAPPASEDYVRLEPGASRSARVELSSLYEMDVTGAYSVRYRGLQSDAAAIWIDGRLPRGTLPPPPQAPQGSAGLTFNSCSNAQQGAIASAAEASLAMATDGEAYLVRARLATRFSRWFGEKQEQAAVLKAHFSSIKEAFAAKPVTVDCACNKPYYAYVYPTQPYVIHVCKAFWPAPTVGTDSKAGTLVHEMSHFAVVAGTNDWVYGQVGAASLANSDPEKALDNADSHEYFGENTPELPMR
jgi:peptidyl-Lys metalloendopeptidase